LLVDIFNTFKIKASPKVTQTPYHQAQFGTSASFRDYDDLDQVDSQNHATKEVLMQKVVHKILYSGICLSKTTCLLVWSISYCRFFFSALQRIPDQYNDRNV
jgi:hypothetical protein